METYAEHESTKSGRRVLLRYSLHHVEPGSIIRLLFELVAPELYIAPVAYEFILEPGNVGLFRELEPRRVDTRIQSFGLYIVHKLTRGKREGVS